MAMMMDETAKPPILTAEQLKAWGDEPAVAGAVRKPLAPDTRLERLSAAATAGEWRALPPEAKKWVTSDAMDCAWKSNHDNDAAFVAILVNAYRSGRLISLDQHERQVAEARTEAFNMAAKVARRGGTPDAEIAARLGIGAAVRVAVSEAILALRDKLGGMEP